MDSIFSKKIHVQQPIFWHQRDKTANKTTHCPTLSYPLGLRRLSAIFNESTLLREEYAGMLLIHQDMSVVN